MCHYRPLFLQCKPERAESFVLTRRLVRPSCIQCQPERRLSGRSAKPRSLKNHCTAGLMALPCLEANNPLRGTKEGAWAYTGLIMSAKTEIPVIMVTRFWLIALAAVMVAGLCRAQ